MYIFTYTLAYTYRCISRCSLLALPVYTPALYFGIRFRLHLLSPRTPSPSFALLSTNVATAYIWSISLLFRSSHLYILHGVRCCWSALCALIPASYTPAFYIAAYTENTLSALLVFWDHLPNEFYEEIILRFFFFLWLLVFLPFDCFSHLHFYYSHCCASYLMCVCVCFECIAVISQ